MDKKEFELLAAAIAALPIDTTRADVAKAIAVAIMNTNRGFKMQKFLDACEPAKPKPAAPPPASGGQTWNRIVHARDPKKIRKERGLT